MNSGLTSLRESSPSLLVQPNPSDKDPQRLTEVRREIEDFYKVRDDLREEIGKLNLQIAKDKDTAKSGTEVKRLKVQKGILLSQIKELLGVMEKLTGTKSDLVSSLDAYGEERTGDLIDISHRIAGELGEVHQGLVRRSGQLTHEEGLLDDMAEYYARLAEMCESSASSNAQKGLELDKRSTDATQKEENLTLREKRAQDMTKEANRKQEEADERLSGADKISRWFENEADREKEIFQRQKQEVTFKEKRLAAEKRELVVERKRLSELHRLIKDKDEALNRKAKELKMVI